MKDSRMQFNVQKVDIVNLTENLSILDNLLQFNPAKRAAGFDETSTFKNVDDTKIRMSSDLSSMRTVWISSVTS